MFWCLSPTFKGHTAPDKQLSDSRNDKEDPSGMKTSKKGMQSALAPKLRWAGVKMQHVTQSM